MHFLGGERNFIKPENTENSIQEQVDFCFNYLKQNELIATAYKLNFFVGANNSHEYLTIQEYICNKTTAVFGREILLNVIAQAPLTRKVVLEVFTYDTEVWNTEMIASDQGRGLLFSNENTHFLLGTVQANGSLTCSEQSEKCFHAIEQILAEKSFSIGNIIRQWNYIKDIISFDGTNQNYQDFNDVRSKYYGDSFEIFGYPAATGIGMSQGGVIIEFIAIKSDKAVSNPVDNPEQIAAHRYSEKVLVGKACEKTTPKFERARFLKYQDRQMMFISGTASIIGEQTIGVDDAQKQTEVTIQNIKRLYSEKVLQLNKINSQNPVFIHCRVYVKNESDFETIKKQCDFLFGDIPMVFIQADICRENLLVEIEGAVIL